MIVDSMEKSVARLENEMKSLKASLPVSGSLVETYIVTENFTKTLPNHSSYKYTITFTPYQDYEKIGINTMSVYVEDWASGPYTSQFNPYSYSSVSNAAQDNSGTISYSNSGNVNFYDGDTFDMKIICSVYGTTPGTLSIIWS